MSRFIAFLLLLASLMVGSVQADDSHSDQSNSHSSGASQSDNSDENNSSLQVSPSSVSMKIGSSSQLSVSNASGSVTVSSGDRSVVTAKYRKNTITLKAIKIGSTTVKVRDRQTTRKILVRISKDGSGDGSGLNVFPSFAGVSVGGNASITISNASGTVTAVSSAPKVASVSYSEGIATIKGLTTGTATITIRDRNMAALVQVSVIGSGGTGTGGGSSSSSYSLLAWNDLGMHCVDGKDYSVFSILPPYNNLHAQLVDKTTGKQVTSGVTLTYEAIPDDTVPVTDPLYGSINTTSYTKTNFWDNVKALFGAQPTIDIGLNLSGNPGNQTISRTPQAMSFSSANGWFEAEGLPVVPTDDNGVKNFYPMVKVVAKDANGTELASAKTVLPVSDEMTCKACHASNSSAAARPTNGWVNDADAEKDWKKNILQLHDDKKMNDPAYIQALASLVYDSRGLAATANGGQPVLCAACHSSNALLTTGQPGIRALTHALHTKHADVKDSNGVPLSSVTNRSSCYSCHPGSVTQCLRGAMGSPTDAAGNQTMSCQSCHGNMQDVGNTARTGWLSQPNCQACHHDGQRETVGVTASGIPKAWTDTRFATNPDTPMAGFSLYRFSKGHGNLQCEACHGATHAIYPSTHSQDNALSLGLQGHTGTVAECTACHDTMPTTVNGGPHGMHSTGDAWVSRHEKAGKTGCTSCHGSDYRGSPLSAIKVAKTINRKSFAAGHQIGCYDCHNGPNP